MRKTNKTRIYENKIYKIYEIYKIYKIYKIYFIEIKNIYYC